MKRREFLEEMLVSTFDVKGIEYLNTTDGVAEYNTGVTVYRDCTYSRIYKMRFNNFWKALFDSDNKEVAIKSNRIKTSDIEIYQNRAKEYILEKILINSKINAVSKENLTLKVTEHNYINIIVKELFNVE